MALAIDQFEAAHNPEALALLILDAQQASGEELNYVGRASKQLESGWKCLDAAQWLVEHQLRGAYNLQEPQIPGQLYAKGLDHFEKGLELTTSTYQAHELNNAYMSQPGFSWLASERQTSSAAPIEEINNTLLSSIAANVADRYAVGTESRNARDRGDYYGQLFEGMMLGMVAESEQFRQANIIALPAPPLLEKRSPSNPHPIDIALWRVDQMNRTSTLIGGLQCKSFVDLREAPREDRQRSDFSVTVYAKRHFAKAGNTTEEIIGSWLNQEYLVEMHTSLMNRIARSGNAALIGALDLEPLTVIQKKAKQIAIAS